MKNKFDNLKKIYRKFIFITDMLWFFILSYAMLTEWYNRDMSSISSMPWLLLSLLFFITAVRKSLKKPPIFLPLFKQLRIILFTFVISLILFTQWYHDGMSSIPFLLGGLLLFIASVTIAIRKFLKKSS